MSDMPNPMHNAVALEPPEIDAAQAAATQRVVPETLIVKFLSNQEQELLLRDRELAIEAQRDAHGFEYGKRAIELQAEDRKNARHWDYQNKRLLFFGVGVCLVIIFGCVGFAMYLNKDDVAKEIVKGLIYVAAGALGGYGAARARNRDRGPSGPETPHKSS